MGIVVTRWHLESTRTLRHLFMSLLALYTLGLVGHRPLGCPKLSALNIFSRYHYSLDYMWDTCLCEAHKRACEEAPQRTMLQSEKHEHVLFIFMETDMPMTSLRCCYRVFLLSPDHGVYNVVKITFLVGLIMQHKFWAPNVYDPPIFRPHLCPQSVVSDLMAAKNSLKFIATLSKMSLFLLFHRFQQQSKTNALNCFSGMHDGLGSLCSKAWRSMPLVGIPSIAQNCWENAQWNRICCVVSGAWWHASQMSSSTTRLMTRFARYWIPHAFRPSRRTAPWAVHNFSRWSQAPRWIPALPTQDLIDSTGVKFVVRQGREALPDVRLITECDSQDEASTSCSSTRFCSVRRRTSMESSPPSTTARTLTSVVCISHVAQLIQTVTPDLFAVGRGPRNAAHAAH